MSHLKGPTEANEVSVGSAFVKPPIFELPPFARSSRPPSSPSRC